MSRIGKAPITVPSNVEVKMSGTTFTAKGAKGVLNVEVDRDIAVSVDNGVITVNRPTEQKRHRAMHGLYRSLIANAIEGVEKGFVHKLELVGVGYKATVANNIVELSLGYSHNILFALPVEVTGSAVTDKGKNPIITLECADKQLLGQITAKLRSFRKVEPYKGKGIRFVGEKVRRKAGKTSAK